MMGDTIDGDIISGDKIGRDKISIYGDVICYPITLRTELRHQFTPLIQEYMKLFAGRDQSLEEIARWLRDSSGGYLVITAPAGFGKTALMAALIQTEPAAFAYHFFHAIKVPHSLDQICFLRNSVEQMAQWHGRYKEGIPDQIDLLVALYNQMMIEELPHSRILILDGIDEINNWSIQNFLPQGLPDGLHVIVTLRDVDQDWMAAYRFPPEQTDHLALDGLDHDAVIEVLGAAGSKAADLIEDQAALDQFLRVAAYPARHSLGADPFCVRLLAEDINTGVLKKEQLSKESRGLNLYLDGWWKQIKALAGDVAAKDLFGTLTVALGAISRGDLEAINPTLVDDWADDFFDELIDRLRRYVAGDEESGYTLAHPRLQRYLRWRLRPSLHKYEGRLLDYCARWPEQDPPSAYCLAYFARHLADAGRDAELFDLIAPNWMAAKVACFQSHRSFAEDLTLIAERTAAGGAEQLPALVRACLVSNDLSTEAPPQILAVLAQIGQGRRAMDYAALIPDADDQAEAYQLIGLALQQRKETALANTAFRAAGITVTPGDDFAPAAMEARKISLYQSRLGDLGPVFLLWIQGGDVSIDLLLTFADEKLEEPERTAVISALTAYSQRRETPQEAFETFKQSVAKFVDWAYPIQAGPFLHDIAEIMVRAGWSSRIWQIADMAGDDGVRAWILAQLAVGLARAGASADAAQAASEVLSIEEEGDLAEAHWLAAPALTAAAQELALAGREKEAAEAVNRVLTTTKAAGFEANKSSTLIAFARTLLDYNQPKQAGEVVRLAADTAAGILDPRDQAGVCEQLLPLFLDLEEDEAALQVADLLLSVLSLLGEERLMADLVTIAQVLGTAVPPDDLAAQIRFYAQYEPHMHGAEVAVIVAPVALKVAEMGVADIALSLANELLALWPHNIGETLAEIAAALVNSGHQAQAGLLIQNSISGLDLDDPQKEEEAIGLFEMLASGLIENGQLELAQSVAEAIPWSDVREVVLAELEEARESDILPEQITKETEEKTAVKRQPMSVEETAVFVAQFNQKLMAGGLPDRTRTYSMLETAAPDLAAIDECRTVWLLFESIRAVDQWW